MKVKSLVVGLLVAGLGSVSLAHAASSSGKSERIYTEAELTAKFKRESDKAFEDRTGINEKFGRQMCESAGLEFILMADTKVGSKLVCGNLSKDSVSLDMNINVTKVVGNLVSMQITFKESSKDELHGNYVGVSNIEMDKSTGVIFSESTRKFKAPAVKNGSGFVSAILASIPF